MHRHFTVVVPPLTVVSRSTFEPHFRHRCSPKAERIGVPFAMVDRSRCVVGTSLQTILKPGGAAQVIVSGFGSRNDSCENSSYVADVSPGLRHGCPGGATAGRAG